MTDTASTGRERSSEIRPPTPSATDLPAAFDTADADTATHKFSQYMQQLVEELTGWRPWMSSDGLVYAHRIGPVTELEQREGLLRTLQGHADPKMLVEAIHAQARIAQRVAVREATRG